MPYEQDVINHYRHGSLLQAIEAALPKLDRTRDTITPDELAAVDEFHIGGRAATDHLLEQLNFNDQHHIIDVGCGLGGASRYIAQQCASQVTGIDLTQEYIDVGNTLCSWTGLAEKVQLQQASALDMPFSETQFDGAIMLHVGMNIEDKTALFQEIHRVLRSDASFAVYDVMRTADGPLSYPVPWSSDTSTCKLATTDQYRDTLSQAGFEVSEEQNRAEFAMSFFDRLKAKTQAKGGPPPLSLHTLMRETTGPKISNMISNIASGRIAPVLMIAQKASA